MKRPIIVSFKPPTSFLKMRHNRGYRAQAQAMSTMTSGITAVTGAVLEFTSDGGLAVTGEKIDPAKMN